MCRLFLFLVLGALVFTSNAQGIRFNKKLDRFCISAIHSSRTIPADRKAELENAAEQLSTRKYIVFSCHTNSRRTLMLQVWSQTAFFWYGLFDTYAFSAGDTVTPVYSGVAKALERSGFLCNKLITADPNGYVISLNSDYPINILNSKNEVGTIDTAKGVVVNICEAEEIPGLLAKVARINLPYNNLKAYEGTTREKSKYAAMNFKVATEMFFLAGRVWHHRLKNERPKTY